MCPRRENTTSSDDIEATEREALADILEKYDASSNDAFGHLQYQKRKSIQ